LSDVIWVDDVPRWPEFSVKQIWANIIA